MEQLGECFSSMQEAMGSIPSMKWVGVLHACGRDNRVRSSESSLGTCGVESQTGLEILSQKKLENSQNCPKSRECGVCI